MKITETTLSGAFLVEPRAIVDGRGFFMESYRRDALEAAGIRTEFIQDNHSLSASEHTLRGLHYQLEPRAQAKLVRVTAGAVLDVIVDIRKGSPSFGQWASFVLSAQNRRQLYVPHGFAHGFCTLAPNTEVQYKVDRYYSPEHDRGIAWNDPALGIEWPTLTPVLSEKDKDHPVLAEAEIHFKYNNGRGAQ